MKVYDLHKLHFEANLNQKDKNVWNNRFAGTSEEIGIHPDRIEILRHSTHLYIPQWFLYIPF
jgi:hypothetical protein